MPNPCTVCEHPQVGEINDRLVQKLSHKQIARDFGLVHDAVSRHARMHQPGAARSPMSVPPDGASGRDNLEAVIKLLKKKLAAGSIRTDEIRELRISIEALDKLSGSQAPRAQSVGDLEGYAEFEALVFQALEPFPEARRALAAALRARLPGEEG